MVHPERLSKYTSLIPTAGKRKVDADAREFITPECKLCFLEADKQILRLINVSGIQQFKTDSNCQVGCTLHRPTIPKVVHRIQKAFSTCTVLARRHLKSAHQVQFDPPVLGGHGWHVRHQREEPLFVQGEPAVQLKQQRVHLQMWRQLAYQ
ncbi:hypothetical protein GCM10008937_06740 [Deinococcus depolymerans]|uniref:Uncharacterized protein n=1 Tax=Deinococcus depolymerans TaxID=392408 RepID=A0ABN1BNG3_9DEIO